MEASGSDSGKKRVAILCGGRSGEHEISLLSACSIFQSLDRSRYDVFLVGITKDGRWFLQENPKSLVRQKDPRTIRLDETGPKVVLPPDPSIGGLLVFRAGRGEPERLALDVVFPVLHGPYGEDGTVQGLLELSGLAYVGAGVLGSAAGMDKDVAKRLLREAGIPIPRFIVIYERRWKGAPEKCKNSIWEKFRPPVFVKPANLGSSVGVSKVNTEGEITAALDYAFEYDTKVIVEEGIEGREIECSVLGNEEPTASVPGEIVPRHEFYSYEAKYLDDQGAELKIPADLPGDVSDQVRRLAVAAYRVLGCEGMGRVDFFFAKNGRLLVSEINTIPGFTRISMYPKLWEASGLGFSDLLDRLIQLALERHERRSRLRVEHS